MNHASDRYDPMWIYQEFERCRPWIQAALDHGIHTHTASDVLESILDMSMQFWPAPRAMMVTEIITFPQAKFVHGFLAGGDMEEVMAMRPSIIDFAKAVGAQYVTISGRRGWVKQFADIGFKQHSWPLVLDLAEYEAGDKK